MSCAHGVVRGCAPRALRRVGCNDWGLSSLTLFTVYLSAGTDGLGTRVVIDHPPHRGCLAALVWWRQHLAWLRRGRRRGRRPPAALRDFGPLRLRNGCGQVPKARSTVTKLARIAVDILALGPTKFGGRTRCLPHSSRQHAAARSHFFAWLGYRLLAATPHPAAALRRKQALAVRRCA